MHNALTRCPVNSNSASKMASDVLINSKYLHPFRKGMVASGLGVSNIIFPERSRRTYKTSVSSKNWNHETNRYKFNHNISAVIAVLTGFGWWLNVNNNKKHKSGCGILPVVHAIHKNSSDHESRRNRFNFIADVEEKSAKSVVCIGIKEGLSTQFLNAIRQRSRNGSGFVVKEDGLILTDTQIIKQPGSAVEVTLQDGRTFEGVVENVDYKNDLATVRIKAENLPVMKLGSSSHLRAGEWVVAIGSCMTSSNTITAGVVCSPHLNAKELAIWGEVDSTQRGSGGPLVNLDGEAIGINTVNTSVGYSFAIPIDKAKEFLRRCEEGSVVNDSEAKKRYHLGVLMVTLTPQLLNSGPFSPQKVTGGFLVWEVSDESPAHDAGLAPGDIITHINNEAVENVAHFYKTSELGAPMMISLIRKNAVLNVTMFPELVTDVK